MFSCSPALSNFYHSVTKRMRKNQQVSFCCGECNIPLGKLLSLSEELLEEVGNIYWMCTVCWAQYWASFNLILMTILSPKYNCQEKHWRKEETCPCPLTYVKKLKMKCKCILTPKLMRIPPEWGIPPSQVLMPGCFSLCLLLMHPLLGSVTFPQKSDLLLKQFNILQTKNLTKSQRFKFKDTSVHVFKILRVKGTTLILPTIIFFFKKEKPLPPSFIGIAWKQKSGNSLSYLWYLCGCYLQRTEFILLYSLTFSTFLFILP